MTAVLLGTCAAAATPKPIKMAAQSEKKSSAFPNLSHGSESEWPMRARTALKDRGASGAPSGGSDVC